MQAAAAAAGTAAAAAAAAGGDGHRHQNVCNLKGHTKHGFLTPGYFKNGIALL